MKTHVINGSLVYFSKFTNKEHEQYSKFMKTKFIKKNNGFIIQNNNYKITYDNSLGFFVVYFFSKVFLKVFSKKKIVIIND